MSGPKTQATLVLIGTLLIGVVIGVTGERMRTADDRPAAGEGRDRRSPRSDSGHREARLPRSFERLELTEVQETQIRAAISRYGPLTREVMDEMMPRLRALRDSAKAEIEALLTGEQRERLAEMDEHFWDRRWEGRRGGRRGGGRRDSSRERSGSVPDSGAAQ